MPSGLPTELPNDLPVFWRHGRSEDSAIGSKGRSTRRAQGEENGLFVRIGFSLEPNQLIDFKELGVVGLARGKVAKPSVLSSQIMGEPAVAEALDRVGEGLGLHSTNPTEMTLPPNGSAPQLRPPAHLYPNRPGVRTMIPLTERDRVYPRREGLPMPRTLFLAIALSWLPGCATIAQALYDTSTAVAPPHPVYGIPVFNVVPEAQEVAQARQAWAQIDAAARQHGIAVDPPGERLVRIRTVFTQLVAVAHRQQLPWEIHLVEAPDVNAFTPGGGMVIVLDGLFGGLVAPEDDEELAAVLAHEIAHVTLLHVPTRQTWAGFGSLAVKATQDDYYRAAYTTEQRLWPSWQRAWGNWARLHDEPGGRTRRCRGSLRRLPPNLCGRRDSEGNGRGAA